MRERAMSLYHQDFAAATWHERERVVRDRDRHRDLSAVRRPSLLHRLLEWAGDRLAPAPALVLPVVPLAPVVNDSSTPALPVVADLVAPVVDLVRPVVDEVVAAVQAQPAASEASVARAG
jgi:hypothetical protein